MGIYANLVASPVVAEASPPRAATRPIVEYLRRREESGVDPDPDSTHAAADAVATIATYTGTPTSGNFSLTFDLEQIGTVGLGTSGLTVTTASIAFNANAATIQTAIDVAMTAAAFPAWTNADIVVSAGGTTFLDGNMVFTSKASGSVSSTPWTMTIADVDLDAGSPGAVVQTVAGQTVRNATQALKDLGVIVGTTPVQGNAPTDWAQPTDLLLKKPRPEVIQTLALAAAIEDNVVGTYTAVADLYALPSMGPVL